MVVLTAAVAGTQLQILLGMMKDQHGVTRDLIDK